MRSNSHPKTQTLAAVGAIRVTKFTGCPHMLTLQAGPVSLRFHRDALAQLHEAVGAALSRLDNEREDWFFSKTYEA